MRSKKYLFQVVVFVISSILSTSLLFNPITLNAQTQPSPQVTLEGTLSMYMVTRYGDSLQELDRYRRTTKEGEYVAFILKTDEKLDMTQYLKGEELAPLLEYGETMQSEFLMVQDFESDEPFSGKDFAAQYANKRIRVTGSLFFPMASWHYVTPVAIEYSGVELVTSDYSVKDEVVSDTLDPMKYYYDFEFRGSEAHAYARELSRFAETLLHDETTFKADLSAKLDKLRITLQTSPDGKLKVYSWHDGDEGSAMNYHSIYQTYRDGRFLAVFMEDYYYEPRAIYQLETTDGPVYLIQYFLRESGWSYAIGVDAFTINKDGGLVPAEIFECIPELYENASGYANRLAVECSPIPSSLYLEGAWVDNFFFAITRKDFYMPHYAQNKKPNEEDVMTDFYHRFEWDGEKFRYKQLVFNPVLAKYLPEGWLKEELELENSIVRIDSVADGSYRYIVWKRDKMFSAAPDKVIPQGFYNAEKQEYHFKDGDNEYVYNTAHKHLKVLHTDPVTKKIAVISINEPTFPTDTNRLVITVTGKIQLYHFDMEGDMVPVKKYRRTGEFEEIGYFIELDHEMDVKPYFMEVEREYWDECGASTIVVSRTRVFCSNDIDLTPYRTRRVRLTGWFESREFGWRNAGPTVFVIQQVEVLENGE